jgi:hypothetical protein
MMQTHRLADAPPCLVGLETRVCHLCVTCVSRAGGGVGVWQYEWSESSDV